MGFVSRIDQNMAKYRGCIRMKNGRGPCLFDVVLQSAWVLYRISKDEVHESIAFLAFQRHVANAIFLKYSKESTLSLSHAGMRNIRSDVCYDDTKHLPGAILTPDVLRAPSSI